MENKIKLRGIVQNIRYSHNVGDIEYNKADLIVKRFDDKEDILTIKFKKFSTTLEENSSIELEGNIRSFSKQIDGRNKVDVYVFSYLDKLKEELTDDNSAILEGKLCKKDTLRTSYNGKQYIHFILANNIVSESSQRLNSYIPCVAWGKLAKDIDANYNISDFMSLTGQLHSREYKKKLDNGDLEIRIAHEFAVLDIKDNTIDEI